MHVWCPAHHEQPHHHHPSCKVKQSPARCRELMLSYSSTVLQELLPAGTSNNGQATCVVCMTVACKPALGMCTPDRSYGRCLEHT